MEFLLIPVRQMTEKLTGLGFWFFFFWECGNYLFKGAEASGATGVGGVETALLEVPHRRRGSGVVEPRRDVKRRRAAQRAYLVKPYPAEAQDRVAGCVRLGEVDVLADKRRLQRVNALLRVVGHHWQLVRRR